MIMEEFDIRIGSLLTVAQSRKFAHLRSENVLLDGIGMKIEPWMKVID
jgi:hypothetical protein